ncbi:hypothetical protein CEXT_660901 [Caerostris extrusa]|uniref:Uncharacterized protein n=1 Tax=Caerostris extrusa TaxID=172846 RepID=A0AAV4MU04_CAEEX|nr:hypothetical protein CEXT_660901 [Caerostris extrusa]
MSVLSLDSEVDCALWNENKNETVVLILEAEGKRSVQVVHNFVLLLRNYRMEVSSPICLFFEAFCNMRSSIMPSKIHGLSQLIACFRVERDSSAGDEL